MSEAGRLIVALDYDQPADALAMAARLDPDRCRVKVGKTLFTRAGPAVVEALQARGFEVFLDLKFHDIPNTVAGACRAAADLGVWMLNVHAAGGPAMLAAAREALDAMTQRPLLIAVTVLTSMDDADLRELGVSGGVEAQVARLAALAAAGGCDGVVCSPREVAALRRVHGPGFRLVTPGIRPGEALAQDQKRSMTPAAALRAGATDLVVGRPITGAAQPLAALEAIVAELDAAQASQRLA